MTQEQLRRAAPDVGTPVERSRASSGQIQLPGESDVPGKRELEDLRTCVGKLDEAMRIEGIDPAGVLGVWCQSIRACLVTFCNAVSASTARVEGRSEVVERAMKAEVERVKIAIEQCRAETMLARMKTAETVEVRKVENVELARELGTEISKTIRTAALVREVRFNRRQNWSAVALVATVLLGCFVGGAVWSSYRADQGVVARCLANQQVDTTGKTYWCAMTVVRDGT